MRCLNINNITMGILMIGVGGGWSLHAQTIGDWRTVTSLLDIQVITVYDNAVWVGTDGGLFVLTENGESVVYRNTEGLAGQTVTDIAVSNDGRVWIAFKNGLLNVRTPGSEEFETIRLDPERFTIYDLEFFEDELYIGSDYGISKYLPAKNEIQATYRNLGNFDRNTPVEALRIIDGRIWAGTQRGIAAASVTSPNLQDPQFWSNYATEELPGAGMIHDFAEVNGSLFAATSKGMIRLQETQWMPAGLHDQFVYNTSVSDGILYACHDEGVFAWQGGTGWERTTPDLTGFRLMGVDNSGRFLLAHFFNGLMRLDDQTWRILNPNSPRGNSFADLTIDQDGNLWAVSGTFGSAGIYRLENGQWINYTTGDGISLNDVTSIQVDRQNRLWCGTPGAGAFVITSLDPFEVIQYDRTDNKLTGSDTPNFVIVDDIQVDDKGNVWLINQYANNGNAIVVVTPEDRWQYFSVSDGLSAVTVNSIDFDQQGRVWFGTFNGHGISVLDYSNTLLDKSDDVWSRLRESDGLISNDISDIAVDQMGLVWIATQAGVNYWDGSQIRRQFGLIDDRVNTIHVDPFDNKWFGSRGGVSVLDRDNFRWTYYYTENSPLVNDNVLAIDMNANTGDAYIGTSQGLSILRTPFAHQVSEQSNLISSPNPFLVTSENAECIIGDIPTGAAVKIFSIAGRLIRTLKQSRGEIIGTKAFWDGRTTDGEIVASGIYVLIAFASDGSKTLGKIAVIREG